MTGCTTAWWYSLVWALRLAGPEGEYVRELGDGSVGDVTALSGGVWGRVWRQLDARRW